MNKFDNPELQEIYEKNEAFLEENKEKLDKLTRDIKQIESFLKENVFLTYEMHLNDVGINFSLIFKTGRIYLHESQNLRPLLENKVYWRLKAAPYLKEFLEKCIENSQI
jgi:hypothetical protein